jgi:hypothetical protein
MEKTIKQKLDETIIQVCKDLNIPYDPYATDTDARAVIIYDAMLWISKEAARGE